MARIKIKDLPKDMKISKEEMKMITGGLSPQPEPPDMWTKIPMLWRTFGASDKFFLR